MNCILWIHTAYAWLSHKCLNCSRFPLMSLDWRNVSEKKISCFIEKNRILCWAVNRNCILYHITRLCSDISKDFWRENTPMHNSFLWRNWAQIYLQCKCSKFSIGVFPLFFLVLFVLNIFKPQIYLERWILYWFEQSNTTAAWNLGEQLNVSLAKTMSTIHLTCWN